MSESAADGPVVAPDAVPEVTHSPAAPARRPLFAGLRGRGRNAADDTAPAGDTPAAATTEAPIVDRATVENTADPGAPDDVPTAPGTALPLTPDDVLRGWQAALGAGGTPDTLLVTGDASQAWLDLTHAHPSGIAQLLAGRPTRLGSLVREPNAHLAARRRARRIRDAAGTLADERGIRAGYLAAGLATWRPGPLRVLDLEADAGPVFAPVLLRGCTLRPVGPGHDDYDLDLDDDALVNPQLLRRLASDHAVRPDGDALAGLAFGHDGFDPRRVFDALADLCRDVPDFRIDPLLVVGLFTAGDRALLSDLEDARDVLLRHHVLGKVLRSAGTPAAAPSGTTTPATQPSPAAPRPEEPAPRDQDPESELLVLDLDPAQQRAVDEACAGHDLALVGPPGTGLTHTLAAVVAALAARGRRVLVVTPRRATADAFLSRLDAAGLRDIALDLHDGVGDRAGLLNAFGAALDGTVDGRAVAAHTAPDGFVDTLHRTIRECRATLMSSTAALHRTRRPWDVSAYEAMVRLCDLMARPEPPSTTVRLPAAVCERLVGERRDAARALLREAATAGLLAPPDGPGHWSEAVLDTPEQAEDALAAATTALAALPPARTLMDGVCAAAGLRAAHTAAQWRPHLELLLGVRDTLDVLVPAVFERPLGDLVAVTGPNDAPPDTRDAGDAGDAGGTADADASDAGATGDAERGYWARRALRRKAKELVRPGVYVKDLHGLLVAARAQAQQWTHVCEGGGRPCVPQGLAEASAAVQEVLDALDVLDACFLAPLSTSTLPELQQRLTRLSADPDGAREQPQRCAISRRLAAEGLAALADDLRRPTFDGRGPDTDAELDLAWWASVLEAIVRSDLRLARHDGHALRRASADLRLAECAHLRDGARRVLLSVAQRTADVAAAQPSQVRWLRDETQRAHRSQWPLDLFRRAPDLVAAIRPVWLMSPDAVARLLPPADLGADGRARPVVDTVVVDDAGQVPVHEVAATLARGRQLVVAGDSRRLPAPKDALSVLDAVATQVAPVRLDRDHRTCDGRMLTPLLDSYPEGWRTVAGTGVTPRLRLEHVVGGAGVPGPGEDVVLSADAEVTRVVGLIADHARRRPEESLMVVTLGERHAERIKEALRDEVGTRSRLRDWLQESWTGPCREPFMVRPAGRVLGLERDDVIVSVGLGRTPHGRVLHRFGAIDGPHGAALLLTALTRARRRTTVVSCFEAGDLDVERLRSPGARLLHRVLEFAGEASARLRTASGDVDVLATGSVDVLADALDVSGAAGDGRAGRGWFDAVTPVDVPPAFDGDRDALVLDLARRLTARGVPVTADADGATWAPDLSLGDPRVPGRLLVALELDGPRYAARSSLRERERQRRDELERAGWTHCRVAAMDLFLDPEGEVARILSVWQTALGEGPDPMALTDGAGSHPRRPWPDVVPGRPVAAYSDEELDAVAWWVLSDGVARTEQDVAAEMRSALGLMRRGARVDVAVGNAARRVVGQVVLPTQGGTR